MAHPGLRPYIQPRNPVDIYLPLTGRRKRHSTNPLGSRLTRVMVAHSTDALCHQHPHAPVPHGGAWMHILKSPPVATVEQF